MMDRQVRHMVRLIDDLLDVSRITRGKIQLQRESVTLASIVEAAVEASRPLVQAGRHELRLSLPDEPVWFAADGTRLAQVVSNLVNNAAKYSRSGGVIALRAFHSGGDAVIEVRDNGMGIPADKLNEVFEMFSQVNRTLDRSQGGLGIGLALVRTLVQMHGGTVTADSAGPDLGSTFTVRIPLQPHRRASQHAEESTEAVAASARRIMIVDDNIDAAESLAEFLEISGNQIRTAHTGPEAIALALEFRPEVVFLDIGLPGISGYEVANQLRRQMKVPTILVAVTGWGTAEDKSRASAAGFDFHLTKPVDLHSIETLLAGLRGEQPSATAHP
jgi:K+-sensing histidine kinase KdpD